MQLENRVVALETEFKIIKGEIKELLVDVREVMNNMENPFYSADSIPEFQTPKTDLPPAGTQEASPEPPASRPEQERKGHKVPPETSPEKALEKIPRISIENGIDTFTLVELMRWTDYTLTTIGRKSLNEILDLYALTGHLTGKVKEVIRNIANLSTEDVAEDGKATMKDNITVISQLSAILNPEEYNRKMLDSIYDSRPWETGNNKESTETTLN